LARESVGTGGSLKATTSGDSLASGLCTQRLRSLWPAPWRLAAGHGASRRPRTRHRHPGQWQNSATPGRRRPTGKPLFQVPKFVVVDSSTAALPSAARVHADLSLPRASPDTPGQEVPMQVPASESLRRGRAPGTRHVPRVNRALAPPGSRLREPSCWPLLVRCQWPDASDQMRIAERQRLESPEAGLRW